MAKQKDAARIRKRKEREEEQKTPMLIVLNTDEKNINYELVRNVHGIFKKVLARIYHTPLNGYSSEFERLAKKTDYLMIVGKGFPENMNPILDIIIKYNYEAKILVQKGAKISALKNKKTIIIDCNCKPEQIKKLLSL
ncbi:hypothetical protein JXE04_00475 [Patescibacteria group bacterium]|nr:hypothetical protein [Patescibacteria group bacterium]